MTNVRAIVEEQARRRAAYDKTLQIVIALLTAATLLVYAALSASGRKLDFSLFYMPLLLVGTVSIYTPKHLQALKDAVSDPDPALDIHFARALVAENAAVAKVGREAFLRRFSDRLPHLDDEGWENVGWGLKNAPADDAEGLLRLLARGAPAVAIERIQDFQKATKVDRLRTAAHAALGDIRLRTARERVLSTVGDVEAIREREAERLRL